MGRGRRSASSAPAMRSTATTPATSRCGWPGAGPQAAARNRRSDRRGTARQSAAGPRRSGRRRLHQLVPGAAPRRARCCAQVLATGGRYGAEHAPARRAMLLEFVSANPTGPLHVGHGRQAAYGATWRTCCARSATRSRASTTSTMPAGRWTSYGQHLGALSASAAVRRCRFPPTAIAADYVQRHRARSCANARRGAARVRPRRCSQGLPPMRPRATRSSTSMR